MDKAFPLCLNCDSLPQADCCLDFSSCLLGRKWVKMPNNCANRPSALMFYPGMYGICPVQSSHNTLPGCCIIEASFHGGPTHPLPKGTHLGQQTHLSARAAYCHAHEPVLCMLHPLSIQAKSILSQGLPCSLYVHQPHNFICLWNLHQHVLLLKYADVTVI